ncbi:barstar family protein [Dactylosporangium roseum]|uniref:Barstar family protein n=1 Tax=Dactylosporangium roseum TaxID=47989 RepID=A0ABY5Z7U0_9ACTN|nr:barstar family protein [Dactylosporangium roseum]UWZ38140.1 barstar family protein [Dactylosporangium roseum]
MTGGTPWVRGELPWLRSGPLYRVHTDALPELSRFLDRWSYHRVDLDGRPMASRAGAHRALATVFGFPDHYGANWDAFADSFADYLAARDEHIPVAILWHDIESAAPATAAEVGWALLEHAAAAPLPVHVFAIGDGDDFDRPSGPPNPHT